MLFWQMVFGEQQTNLANFTVRIGKFHQHKMLVKLNCEFFAKRCAPATFWLGAQRLVKL